MTYREFYTAIVNGETSEEITAFAQTAIAKLDSKNANRNSKPSKVAIANEPIKEAILAYVKENPNSISTDIGKAVNITTQKAATLCRQLTESGKLIGEEVKVPKLGKRKSFRLAQCGRTGSKSQFFFREKFSDVLRLKFHLHFLLICSIL